MPPEHEAYAAHFRAHEGADAIYREALGFSYVRVCEVRVEESGMGATIEHIPVRGLLDRSGTWNVWGSWGGVFCDEHAFRIPGISLAAYFSREVIDGVLDVCASLPGEYSAQHVDAITDLISDYWDRVYAPDPQEPRE